MTVPNDRLYNLLPAVYRQRDFEVNEPLRALLSVISEQVDIVDADIARLYENWFIETCDEWVAIYIGDLIGYQVVHEAGEPGDGRFVEGRMLNRFLIPRREIANTVRYRRRKGTLALLESLGNDVGGWPARAVEFDRLACATQSFNHLRPGRGRTTDIRRRHALTQLNSPFDSAARSADVRRINSRYRTGRFNLPDVGLFLWRLQSFPVTKTSPYCVEEAGPHCFTFSGLGNDSPLFARPSSGGELTEINVPDVISRSAFAEHKTAFYGEAGSFAIWAPGWGKYDPALPIPAEAILPADLSSWYYHPSPGFVAVDPALGRIAFPPGHVPERIAVSYRCGFSTAIGGGEYERPITAVDEIYRVSTQGREEHSQLRQALHRWKQHDPARAVIELTDSQIYDEEHLHIELKANHHLEIRAAKGARPIIRLLDYQASHTDAILISGEAGSSVTFDGVMVAGRGIQIKGGVAEFVLRHSTLVPGWALNGDCHAKRPHEPSLSLIDTAARVRVEHSILGAIQAQQSVEPENEPNTIVISDSILDSTSTHGHALCAPGSAIAYANLVMRRCTVFGRVLTHAVELAENSIFTSEIAVARRQKGCVRFCYVPAGSRTPRQYECINDRALHSVFESELFGTPAYCQLAENCPIEIRRGADDESEMGVFHDLFQPQRDASLRVRLEEFVPAGSDVGVIYVT